MSVLGGDPASLQMMASDLKSDAATAQAQSGDAAAAGTKAAAGAGRADVGGAAQSLGWAMAIAVMGTAAAASHLAGTSGGESSGLIEAGGS